MPTMLPKDSGRATQRRALIVIPGTVNYFYNQSGRRIADALQSLGVAVDVRTLSDCETGEYDWCLFSNLAEVVHSVGGEGSALPRIADLRDRCAVLTSCAIDCVGTPWYHRLRELGARAGVPTILDLGLRDQTDALRPVDRDGYRFVYSGLTPTEQRTLDALDPDDPGRTIPWAFVGHVTAYRAALVDHLIQQVDPRGFVYIPPLSPYTETNSPHLNQTQYEQVLGKTRYQVWCSHHSHFYMEPERFRTSLLTGGVPIKIIDDRHQQPAGAPLDYLMIEAAEVGSIRSDHAFARLRRRFVQDWARFPSLAQELVTVLSEAGITLPDSSVTRAA